MSKLRRQVSTHIANVAETKNLTDLKNKTGNLYESIAIIAKRANQINITMKKSCIASWKSLPLIPTVWKKFMRIRSKLRSLKLTKGCPMLRF